MLCLSACSTDAPTETTESIPMEFDGSVLYQEACAKLSSVTDLVMEYELNERRTVGNDTHTRQIIGTDSYCAIGTDAMECVISQSLTYGTYQTDYTEYFSNGTAYAHVNDSVFSCPMDAESFLSRQIPVLLLDSNLYSSIHAVSDANGFLLTFADATVPESWAVPFGPVQQLYSQGNAILDPNGMIQRFSYVIEYLYGGVQYRFEIDTKLTTADRLDLSAIRPSIPQSPVPLTDLDAPKYLLRSVGDLFAAGSISAEITQMLVSEVYTLTQKQQSTLQLSGSGDQLSAFWDTSLTVTDYRGNPATKTQTDRYQDGRLTRIVNGEIQSEQKQPAEEIRIRWENQILNSFFALDYLADADITDDGSTFTLKLTGNEAFCDAVAASVRSVIPNDLDSIADSFETGIAAGFMTIDKTTGLPVSMGMEFSRTHMISGVSYPLSFSLTQHLKLSDAGTPDSLN